MNNSIKYLAFALALIYQAVIFRPFVSVVTYAVNKDFIAANLCEQKEIIESTCEGKCYLKKELKKVEEPKSNSEESSNKRTQNSEEEVLHTSENIQFSFSNSTLGKTLAYKYSHFYTGYSVSVDVPPPVV